MKLAWDRLIAAWVIVGAAACGGSDPGGSQPALGGGGGGALGGAGAPGGAGAGAGAGTGTAGAGAGTAGAGMAGGSSAGAGGAAGATAGGSSGAAGSGGAVGSSGGTGSGCKAPGTICWDFEEGALPTGWTAYRNEFNGSLVVDDTKAHQGTHALHAKDLLGGQENVQGGPKKTIRYTLPANFGPVMWGRAWVFTTAAPQSHSGLFNARYPRPGTTDTDIGKLDWYEIATYQAKFMGIWHVPEVPTGTPEWVKVSTMPVIVNDWTCWEWQFDAQNGTAAEAADPRIWINGVEQTWGQTFVYPDGAARATQEKAGNFTTLETGVYLYQGLPSATNTWIDELGVGRERIGCL